MLDRGARPQRTMAQRGRELRRKASADWGVRACGTTTHQQSAGRSASPSAKRTFSDRRPAWRDGAVDESGFAIDRSDGVDFREIARLVPGVARFVDASVARRVTYAYRVRAMGHDGSSRASNVAVVTMARAPVRYREDRRR